MSSKNVVSTWSSIRKSLHWILFALVSSQISIGIFVDRLDKDMPSQLDLSLQLDVLHQGIGLTIVVVAFIALIWRLMTTRPPMVEMPLWQKIFGYVVQNLIHLFIMLMPLTGFAQTQSAGLSVTYFNLFTFPKFFDKSEEFLAITHNMHEMQGWILVFLIVLHISGALKHHYFDRDETLVRMLPDRGQ